jgi:hypothetical protein
LLLTAFNSFLDMSFAGSNARMCANDFGRIDCREGGLRQQHKIDNFEPVSSRDAVKDLADARTEED